MNLPEDKLAPIKEAILSGQKITAIKLYREATGTDLAEAKDAAEKIEAELRAASPEKFKAAPAGKGCLGVVVMVCVVFTVIGVSTGCRGTLRTTSKHELQKFDGGSQPVYVTNPELKFEHEVLKASGIYPLTHQTNASRHLTLRPIRQFARCGNPLMLSAFTLGIIPGEISGARTFEYELESDGKLQQCSHCLPLYERYSIWEHFVRHNDKAVLADALTWSTIYHTPRSSAESTH